MKNSGSIVTTARRLFALALCGVGVVSFLLGIVMFFGGLMKDRKSDPDPTFVQILIGVGVGSVIMASAVACFVFASRLVKRISHESQPDKKFLRSLSPAVRCHQRPNRETMITLNVFVRVKPEHREELLEVGRTLFNALAKEPTFIDAWINTAVDQPDLIVVYERWNETKESFVQNILPKPFYGPYLALLEQVGLGREAYWLEERGSWRA